MMNPIGTIVASARKVDKIDINRTIERYIENNLDNFDFQICNHENVVCKAVFFLKNGPTPASFSFNFVFSNTN